jgi:hypothetical protein
MAGWGKSDELPPDLANGSERVLAFRQGEWQVLRPFGGPGLSQRWRYGIVTNTFGPEISFGAEMAKAWPGETIGIIKVSEGGREIKAFLPPGEGGPLSLLGKPTLYEKMMTALAEARASRDVELCGFVWMQGGTDMKTRERGAAYYDRQKRLIEVVRRDTGVPDLPFLIGTYRAWDQPDDLADWEPKPRDYEMVGAPDVLRAKWRLALELPNVKLVFARDLPKHRDGLHYNTEGQLALGRLFAAAFLELRPKP